MKHETHTSREREGTENSRLYSEAERRVTVRERRQRCDTESRRSYNETMTHT